MCNLKLTPKLFWLAWLWEEKRDLLFSDFKYSHMLSFAVRC